MIKNGFKKQSGQALIELLIGITVGGILIIGAAALIVLTLRISASNKFLQAASFLGQEMVEKLEVYAERKWSCPNTAPKCGVYQLIDTSGGGQTPSHFSSFAPFEVIPDAEIVSQDSVNYTRYFYIEKVSRDSGGDIESGYNLLADDLSTLKGTVVVEWTQNGQPASIKFIRYLTRHSNQVTHQTDWSSGGGQSGPFSATSSISVFDTSKNIDWSAAGEIKLD